MTATNMCSNFGGKWDSPPMVVTARRFFGWLRKIRKWSSKMKNCCGLVRNVDLLAICVVYSCRGKVAGVLFCNILRFWRDTGLDGVNLVKIHNSLYVFFLVSLYIVCIYIERITDAYNQ